MGGKKRVPMRFEFSLVSHMHNVVRPGKSVLRVIFLTAFVTSIIQTNPKAGLNVPDNVIKLTHL